jgi:hypothetical protein
MRDKRTPQQLAFDTRVRGWAFTSPEYLVSSVAEVMELYKLIGFHDEERLKTLQSFKERASRAPT